VSRVTREFFSVRTVADAREGFRPARRTKVEDVALDQSLGRTAAAAVRSPSALPGFARAAVDGHAVRAADTFGASAALPAVLELVGEVAMGSASELGVDEGQAAAIPTGGALPTGADAVVMVEQTSPSGPAAVEIHGAVAPGEAVVRPDEDVAEGDVLLAEGRAVRAEHLGLLAAAGVTSMRAYTRPRVAIVSTGDELVPPDTPELAPGTIRDATASALAGMVTTAGGIPDQRGIVPDDAGELRAALQGALADCDLVTVSAGSSVGARDLTAEVVGSLGPPGVWCHGLALKPGKPTLLAECDGVPVIGLPGNPASALVVFGLLGVPLVRMVGGQRGPAPKATATATLARDLPSAAGRLDVVQVTLADGQAEPLFAKSSALSALARADGQILVQEDAAGLYAGTEVTVELHDTPPGR
jgi:molybdopterin molybdotransferase